MLTRLKKARKDLGLTQAEFAKELGITQQSYNLIEKGKTSLSDKHIKPICAIFNISEEWLRDGIGQEFVNDKQVQEIVKLSSKLCPENRDVVLDLIVSLLQKQWNEYTDPTPTTGEGE